MAVSSAASSTERVSSASRSESASIFIIASSSFVNRVSFESFASSFSFVPRSFSEGHFPGGSSSSRLASDSTYGTPSSSNLTSASGGMYRNDFTFAASTSRASSPVPEPEDEPSRFSGSFGPEEEEEASFGPEAVFASASSAADAALNASFAVLKASRAAALGSAAEPESA